MIARNVQLELRTVLKEILSHEAGSYRIIARQCLDSAFGLRASAIIIKRHPSKHSQCPIRTGIRLSLRD
jgi:hypothetical protein